MAECPFVQESMSQLLSLGKASGLASVVTPDWNLASFCALGGSCMSHSFLVEIQGTPRLVKEFKLCSEGSPNLGVLSEILVGHSVIRDLNSPYLPRPLKVIYVEKEDVGIVLSEFIGGPNLAEFIGSGSISARLFWQLTIGVLRGLAALHSAHLPHGDLRMENIKFRSLEPELIPVLVDWASPCIFSEYLAEGSEYLAESNRTKRENLSPELLDSSVRLSLTTPERFLAHEAGDIWALGHILKKICDPADSAQWRLIQGLTAHDLNERLTAAQACELAELSALEMRGVLVI